MIDFCKTVWDDITGKLKPWVKYTYGIVAFVVCMTAICLVLPFILALLPLVWVEDKIKPYIKKFFRWAFMKEGVK
jgi:hypothetical protein